jgi:hypothetical protein
MPPPINYLMIVVQAVLLALSALFLRKVGAIYVGAVGGLLTALGSPGLGPFTFIFAVLFGAFVDGFFFIFRISGSPKGVKESKLMVAMALSTMLIAIVSYSAFASFPLLIPLLGSSIMGLFIQRTLMLDALVLFMGPVSGAVAGYAASYLWNKYLKNICI